MNAGRTSTHDSRSGPGGSKVAVFFYGSYMNQDVLYIAPALDGGAPQAEYVDRIVRAAREHGLPTSYVAKLESFRR